ncbi:MAG: hypothetical protein ACYTEK_07185 [Planctomycetota bacterium]|jgi:hypothetical protein
MKTANRKTLTITMCILWMVLASATSVWAFPPDNAAVLYYRAFMVLKEPSDDVVKMMDDLRGGKIKSNDEIRQYVQENRPAIELLETAAHIANCDWGRNDSKGFDLLLPELAKMRQTTFLFIAEAQILSEKGDYKTALNKCMNIHRMAWHVGDDLIISYLVGVSINTMANKRIEDILSNMPEDLATLAWLKSQIVDRSKRTTTIRTAIAREKEIAIKEIRREKLSTILQALGDEAGADATTAAAIEKIRRGGDEFFKASRDYYANVMTDMQVALDLPYQQSHKKLEELTARVR